MSAPHFSVSFARLDVTQKAFMIDSYTMGELESVRTFIYRPLYVSFPSTLNDYFGPVASLLFTFLLTQ